MHFDLDIGNGNQIKAYTQGQININGIVYTENLIVSPDLIQPWNITTLNELRAEHLEVIIALKPDIVLIGSGAKTIFPQPAQLELFYQNKIPFEIMQTTALCGTYNIIMSEGRYVVAAIIV